LLAFFICEFWSYQQPPESILIVIDPAHGGQDKVIALTDKVAEKDITLAVALALRKELAKENNLEVVLTVIQIKRLVWTDRKIKYCEDQTGLCFKLSILNAGFGKSASGFELIARDFSRNLKKRKKGG